MSLIQGALYPDANIIHDQRYEEKYKLFQNVVKVVNVAVPKPGLKICYICVTDVWTDGTNGTATISAGGLHTAAVAIQLKSQFSKGLTNGSLLPGAICIHDASYDVKYKLLKTLEKIVTVEVPKAGLRICYVSVTDLWADGSNGTATIVSGGINSGGVVIQLKSKYSKGFAFRVQVYASK